MCIERASAGNLCACWNIGGRSRGRLLVDNMGGRARRGGGFGLSHSVTVDENKYDGHLSLKQGGVYLDLFPFRNSGFRVTGGALINDDELRAHAVPNAQGNYKIGDDFVPAVGAAPSAVAKLRQ